MKTRELFIAVCFTTGLLGSGGTLPSRAAPPPITYPNQAYTFSGAGFSPVPGVLNVKAVAVEYQAVLAVTRDGRLVQSGMPEHWVATWPPLTNVVAVGLSYVQAAALTADGRVIDLEDEPRWPQPPGLSNVIALDVTGQSSDDDLDYKIAVTSDGRIVTWGSLGFTFNGEAEVPGVVTAAGGWSHIVALKADGTVVQWNLGSEPAAVAGLSNVVAVAAGGVHSLALKADGTVVAWGQNFRGQLDVPPGLSNVVAIAASEYQSIALRGDGTVVGWPGNVPSGLSGVMAIASGAGEGVAIAAPAGPPPIRYPNEAYVFSGESFAPVPGFRNIKAFAAERDWVLGVTREGHVIQSGLPEHWVATWPPLTNVVAVGLSHVQAAALTADGRIIDLEDEPRWPQPPGLSNVIAFDVTGQAGDDDLDYKIAVTSDGQVVTWGHSGFPPPATVPGVVTAAGGWSHIVALKNDGTVVEWDLGNAPAAVAGLSNVVAVAAGGEHSLALKADGTVVAWGENFRGQLDIPPGLSNVVAIAAAEHQSLALKSDGTLAAWGVGYFGESVTPPAALSNVIAIAAGGHRNLALVSPPRPPEPPLVLVPRNAVWRYSDEGINYGEAWQQPSFNDDTWPSGPAQLGFGDGDEATVLRHGAVTYYFRHRFMVSDPTTILNLTVRLLRDDGGIVYLNGAEVFRSNMPQGPVSYTNFAASTASGMDETTAFYSAQIPANVVSGMNSIAVEVHQSSAVNGDLSFDLELIANGSNENDLPIVTIAAVDDTASEINPALDRPEDPGVFRVSRTGPTDRALRVNFLITGSAANGQDYQSISNWVEIPAGSPSADVIISVIDDSIVESTESVTLRVTRPFCGTNSTASSNCYLVGIPADHATVSILDDDTAGNFPPSVSLISPPDGAVYSGPTNILLHANANDANGFMTIQYVEFFEGNNSLGIATNYPTANPLGPFVRTWNNVQPGQYTLTAVAVDDHGARGTSAPNRIVVQGGEPVTTLIATGSVWKYLDNGSDQGTAWRERAFDDSPWSSGPGQLGYGDGDEATIVIFGPNPTNKYITTYFRRSFDLNTTSTPSNLTLRVLRDDGVVVYLNGVEVFRNNMPDGPITYTTQANLAAGSDENTYLPATIPSSAIVAGRNVIATEVHQVNGVSSDLGFDLELVAGAPPPPPPRAVITVVALDSQASEANITTAIDTGRFGIRRSGRTDVAFPVYFTLGGTAENGVDYNFVSNRVFFSAGMTQAVVTIAPRFDEVPEGTETVVLTIEAPVCAAIAPPPPECYEVGSPNQATVFISDGPGGTNRPPIVRIVSPTNNATFTAGSNIRLVANATDSNGTVVAVEFFAGNMSLGQGVGSNNFWSLTWSNVAAGDYSLTARARDDGGLVSTSPSVLIHVRPDDPGTNATLIAMGSVWRYNDLGSDLGTNWTRRLYDDSAWSAGPAQLGYGDGDEATIVSFGPDPNNKFVTTYFRHRFQVSNAANIRQLTGRLLHDDGSVVYLNGVEVLRANLPAGQISFNTLATASAENQIVDFTAPASLLVNGENVVAVEVHQNAVASSDLSFDLSLTTGGPPPPEQVVVTVVALDAQASETNSTGTIDTGRFAIRRTSHFDIAVPVNFTLSGSASNGVDYNFISNRVVIPAGSTQAVVTVTPRADGISEGTETVVLTLQPSVCPPIFPPPPECYVVGSPNQATVFIADAPMNTNRPPIVRIVSPTNGASFTAGSDIRLVASAIDSNGTVLAVEFFAGSMSLGQGTGTNNFWSLTWSNVAAGDYSLTARARDNGGLISTSPSVLIHVVSDTSDSDGDGVLDSSDQCPNTPPGSVVNANGCSIAQLCPCDSGWASHPEYVRCVMRQAWELYREGRLTADQRRAIIREAIQSACGRHQNTAEAACIYTQPQTADECRLNGLLLFIGGDMNGSCVIECSTDLINWTTHQTLENPVSGTEVTCPMDGEAPARFYRVRLWP